MTIAARQDKRSTGNVQVDSAFFLEALERRCLVGSPRADVLADPFSYGSRITFSPIPILFSDIPDTQFRKPQDVIRMSHIAGGTKS